MNASPASMTPSPPFDALEQALPALCGHGVAVLEAASLGALMGSGVEALAPLRASWNELPPDDYLRDGGHYRRRRHSCFVVEGAEVTLVPHRAHWQPVQYNALHGGIERWFEPMDPAVLAAPAWPQLIAAIGSLCSAARVVPRWYVEAHQFRIDTTGGIGRPTPEGAHRDGVDFVAVILVAREGVKGGETRVFDAHGPAGQRFTMSAPWTTLLLDDERMIHETTPIQPTADATTDGGYRDTLVITYRAAGFQGPTE